MEDVTPFELERLLYGLPPNLYYLEIALRVLATFFVLLLILRFLGKRGQNNLSPMQNVLMISMGSAAGDVMIMPDVPLFYSYVVLIMVPGLITLLEFGELRSDFLYNFTTAEAESLVKHGKIQEDSMKKNRMTNKDLFAMLRLQKIEYLEEVKLAVFEPSGELSVFKYEDESKYSKQTSLLADFDI